MHSNHSHLLSLQAFSLYDSSSAPSSSLAHGIFSLACALRKLIGLFFLSVLVSDKA